MLWWRQKPWVLCFWYLPITSQVQVTCSIIGEEIEQSRKNSDFECRHHYDQILSSLLTTLCHFVALSEPYKSLLGRKMDRIQRYGENMWEISTVFPRRISVQGMLGLSFLLTYLVYFKYSKSPYLLLQIHVCHGPGFVHGFQDRTMTSPHFCLVFSLFWPPLKSPLKIWRRRHCS